MTTLILNLNDPLASSIIAPSVIAIDVDERLAKQQEIAIIWSIEDVRELRPELTDEQAWEVLEEVKHRHDASIGINWNTLQCFADDLFPENSTDTAGE